MSRSSIISFQENKSGRDFVVGDIHGCYSLFRELLNFVDFRYSTDRIFCSGDLIDRGPSSFDAMSLIKKPWFFSCRGNHEQMLIEHLRYPDVNCAHDGLWLDKIYRSITARQEFSGQWLHALDNLPFAISVGEGENKFYVVHAEVLEEKMSVSEDMLDNWDFKDPVKARRRSMWGRSLHSAYEIGRPVKRAHESNLPIIYCGHTIVERPMQIARQVFIDGGAYLAYDVDIMSKMKKKGSTLIPSLRMINAKTKECYSIETSSGVVSNIPIYIPRTL